MNPPEKIDLSDLVRAAVKVVLQQPFCFCFQWLFAGESVRMNKISFFLFFSEKYLSFQLNFQKD